MDLKHTRIDPAGHKTVHRTRIRGFSDGWYIVYYDELGVIVESKCQGPFHTEAMAERMQLAQTSASVDVPGANVQSSTAAGRSLLRRGRAARRRQGLR